ncbi:MAG TPA: hypothetical protein VH092_26220 [Urbifossiella sp.]|jgi:hypothetical protein|nr:hypothetical protein [Urbifossiella sp.]
MADWLLTGPFYRFGSALLRARTQTAGVRDVPGEAVPLAPGTRFRVRFPGGTVDPPAARRRT